MRSVLPWFEQTLFASELVTESPQIFRTPWDQKCESFVTSSTCSRTLPMTTCGFSGWKTARRYLKTIAWWTSSIKVRTVTDRARSRLYESSYLWRQHFITRTIHSRNSVWLGPAALGYLFIKDIQRNDAGQYQCSVILDKLGVEISADITNLLVSGTSA